MLILLPLPDGQIATWLRSNHSIYVTRYKDKPLGSPDEELDKYTEYYKEKFR